MTARGDPPPGPRSRWWGLPLLRAMFRDYLGFTANLQRLHGDVVAMRIGPERSWDLFHPDDVRTALVDHADHLVRWERGVEVFAQTFGQGLLVAEGEAWRRQRRMLAPGFMPRRVQGYAGLMVEAAREALEAALPPGLDDAVLPMEDLFNTLTMDVIMRTLFSNRAPDLAHAAAQATQVLSRAAMQEMFWPVSLPDGLPLPHKAAKRRALRVLNDLVGGQIDARRHLPAAEAPNDDLLAMLLSVRDDDGSGLGADELRDQCMVIFQAGHETSATALLWWSWLMASHPEVAARAQREVDEQLAGRDPDAATASALPYLQATLKEALTTDHPGPKVVIAQSECMLNKQRRVKPQVAAAVERGERVVKEKFGVDAAVCSGDHACMRLSGCPSLTLKNSGDPLKPDPVAHVDDGCVACGHCGEVADAAVLCPSFYRVEWVRNPSRWERTLDGWRRRVVGWFQARQQRALRARALYAEAG